MYSVGVPIKFPWKQHVRKKMANSRFAILMALFLPNRVVSKFCHVQACIKTRRRQVKLFLVSHKTKLVSCHNSCMILMTMLSCRLKNYIILSQFHNFVACTMDKKLHDLLVQFVNNRYL